MRIDVALYNRSKGFEKTAQFATWMTTSRPNPGPIKTVHISNCMFNLTTGAHKLHKEFVKMKAGAYYYQPQTQLNAQGGHLRRHEGRHDAQRGRRHHHHLVHA